MSWYRHFSGNSRNWSNKYKWQIHLARPMTPDASKKRLWERFIDAKTMLHWRSNGRREGESDCRVGQLHAAQSIRRCSMHILQWMIDFYCRCIPVAWVVMGGIHGMRCRSFFLWFTWDEWWSCWQASVLYLFPVSVGWTSCYVQFFNLGYLNVYRYRFKIDGSLHRGRLVWCNFNQINPSWAPFLPLNYTPWKKCKNILRYHQCQPCPSSTSPTNKHSPFQGTFKGDVLFRWWDIYVSSLEGNYSNKCLHFAKSNVIYITLDVVTNRWSGVYILGLSKWMYDKFVNQIIWKMSWGAGCSQPPNYVACAQGSTTRWFFVTFFGMVN